MRRTSRWRGCSASRTTATTGFILNALSTVCVVLTAGLPEAVTKLTAQRPSLAPAIAREGLRLQARVAVLLGVGYALASPLLGARAQRQRDCLQHGGERPRDPRASRSWAVAQGTFNGQHRFWAQSLLVGGGQVLRAVAVVVLTLL